MLVKKTARLIILNTCGMCLFSYQLSVQTCLDIDYKQESDIKNYIQEGWVYNGILLVIGYITGYMIYYWLYGILLVIWYITGYMVYEGWVYNG